MTDIADPAAFVEKKVSFAENDLRLAGALTTPLFFSRYATTGINKNRRRAAAIFRIFLCDKMTAAIPAMETIDDATFNLLYPEMAKAQANQMGMTLEESRIVKLELSQIFNVRRGPRLATRGITIKSPAETEPGPANRAGPIQTKSVRTPISQSCFLPKRADKGGFQKNRYAFIFVSHVFL